SRQSAPERSARRRRPFHHPDSRRCLGPDHRAPVEPRFAPRPGRSLQRDLWPSRPDIRFSLLVPPLSARLLPTPAAVFVFPNSGCRSLKLLSNHLFTLLPERLSGVCIERTCANETSSLFPILRPS